ncbi:hypothetical protein N0V82_007501 [Gnomoniopsis sp. IMI 355080]|nr:hypothetical protein N0V82_007501 [Gnomoniopsis sp. IMI 355080]
MAKREGTHPTPWYETSRYHVIFNRMSTLEDLYKQSGDAIHWVRELHAQQFDHIARTVWNMDAAKQLKPRLRSPSHSGLCNSLPFRGRCERCDDGFKPAAASSFRAKNKITSRPATSTLGKYIWYFNGQRFSRVFDSVIVAAAEIDPLFPEDAGIQCLFEATNSMMSIMQDNYKRDPTLFTLSNPINHALAKLDVALTNRPGYLSETSKDEDIEQCKLLKLYRRLSELGLQKHSLINRGILGPDPSNPRLDSDEWNTAIDTGSAVRTKRQAQNVIRQKPSIDEVITIEDRSSSIDDDQTDTDGDDNDVDHVDPDDPMYRVILSIKHSDTHSMDWIEIRNIIDELAISLDRDYEKLCDKLAELYEAWLAARKQAEKSRDKYLASRTSQFDMNRLHKTARDLNIARVEPEHLAIYTAWARDKSVRQKMQEPDCEPKVYCAMRYTCFYDNQGPFRQVGIQRQPKMTMGNLSDSRFYITK